MEVCELRSMGFRQRVQQVFVLADASQNFFVRHGRNKFRQGVRRNLCNITLSVLAARKNIMFIFHRNYCLTSQNNV